MEWLGCLGLFKGEDAAIQVYNSVVECGCWSRGDCKSCGRGSGRGKFVLLHAALQLVQGAGAIVQGVNESGVTQMSGHVQPS